MATEREQHQDVELRVLHWNIHSWRDDSCQPNLDAVAELVQTTDPHVVSLVEVDETWGKPSVLNDLAECCGYASVFAPAFEFGGDEAVGGFGNALLTKLPILAVRQRQLLWPPRIYDGSEPSEPRTAVFAKLQTPSGDLWIGSTHLPRGEAHTRTSSLQRLVAFAESLDGCWLMCGDFNMPAAEWIRNYPHLAVQPGAPEPTYPTAMPREAIDYCVAPSSLTVEARVIATQGSDHLPVLVSATLAGS